MQMEMSSRPHITLYFEAGNVPGFTMLFQSGFVVRAGGGDSIRSFLVDAVGVSPEIIETLIQSVFLDGKPVDDLDAARIREGSTLALSGAMPGLVGATMRRGGYYASLRSGISHTPEDCREERCSGDVTVKLFNLVASQVGPALLERGILVRSADLRSFLASRPAEFWSACRRITWDGRETNVQNLQEAKPLCELILFSVKIAPPGP